MTIKIITNLTIVFFTVLTVPLKAQFYSKKDFKDLNDRKVLVFYKDTTFESELAPINTSIKSSRDKYYSWYKQKEIFVTQGTYDGSLLHGTFKKFDPDHKLRIKGGFRYGLKHGKWYYLNENGSLSKYEIWRKGELSKPFSFYSLYSFRKNKKENKELKKTEFAEKKIDSIRVKKKRNKSLPVKEMPSDSVNSINNTNFGNPR